ncbi:MAG TPA: DNA internalization-related competence protein ComEC/Rec2 [Candidatus Eremiobacteraceae bacterium]|nr:DNA internalization-related competence protein ComEC/Rec2 [Candidatus Eremiobacteraceae bacterium]
MQSWIIMFRNGHAFAIAFAAYACGVVAAAHGSLVLALCTALIALVFACALRRGDPWVRAARELIIVCACASAAGAALGARALDDRTHPPFAEIGEHHVSVSAVALERPRPATSGVSVRVRIALVSAPRSRAAQSLVGRVALLEMPGSPSQVRIAGRMLLVRARVTIPGGPRNDGEPAERDQLADQGVAAILSAPAGRDITVGGPAPGVEAWLARLRGRFAASVEAKLPPLEATVLEGVLWGDRGNLPADLRQEFSDTGTVHVLTTAGLHLGIMAGFISFALGRLPLPRTARIALVVSAAWAYAAIAGLHLPTIRAASMLTAGIAAHESGRGRTPSAVLAAAAFAVGLPQPLALLSPSFALSFACVGGIALLGPAFEGLGLCGGSGWEKHAVELARTSVVVQIALWPLQALYFNAFTPYAVIANMLVVPLIGAVMACGAAFVAAAAFAPLLAGPLGNLAWWGVTIVTAIVERASALPGAHIDLPPPSHVFLILYWCGLAAFALAVRARTAPRVIASYACAASIGLAVVYCAPGIAAALDPTMRLDAIDVGQADCMLLRAPGMHAMLIDGGGKLERGGAPGQVVAQPIGDVIANKTVVPFLLRHWVLRLDAVVLTHPHGDHAGGLPVILAHEGVGVLYDSGQLYGGPAYRRALEVVRERRIPYRVARRGETFDLGPTTRIRILAPELPLLTGTSSDINNNSVVLRVEFGRAAMLLTGDAQSEAEARLLSHRGSDLRADILKVGHHGSAYSSTPAFLAAVRPKIAVISCGLHNVFGHPSPRTLAALDAAGAYVYRTDLDGGISIDVSADGLIFPIATSSTTHTPGLARSRRTGR